MDVIHQHRKPLIALLAVFLLSVTMLAHHSHDGVLSDTACVVCLHQANQDSASGGTPKIPDVVVTRAYADHFHPRLAQFSCIPAVARGPPTFLVG